MGNLSYSHEQRYAKGETILTQGARGDRTFVIKTGEVLICKQGDSIMEMVPIEALGPGEMFGEMYLGTDHMKLTANVIAMEDVVGEVFFEADVLKDLETMSPFQKQVFRGLAGRLDKTTEGLARHKIVQELMEDYVEKTKGLKED